VSLFQGYRQKGINLNKIQLRTLEILAFNYQGTTYQNAQAESPPYLKQIQFPPSTERNLQGDPLPSHSTFHPKAIKQTHTRTHLNGRARHHTMTHAALQGSAQHGKARAQPSHLSAEGPFPRGRAQVPASRAQADPCPRSRARASAAGLPRSTRCPSRLAPGANLSARSPARTPPLTAPPGGGTDPAGCPFPSAGREPLPASGGAPHPHGPSPCCLPRRSAGTPTPPPRVCLRATPPRARRPLPERRRQQGLRAARALMAAYPGRRQPPGTQQPGEGLPRRCGKRGGPMWGGSPAAGPGAVITAAAPPPPPPPPPPPHASLPAASAAAEPPTAQGQHPTRHRPFLAANRPRVGLDGRRRSANGER